MAEKINKDAVYRAAKSKEKDYFINDGGGLYLWVKTNGSKLWQFVYTVESNRKRLALGAYPGVTLESARRKAEELRQQLANGTDPADSRNEAKKTKQLAKLNKERVSDGLPIRDSFVDVSRQWLDSIVHLTTPTTHIKKTSRIEWLAFPTLGDKPIKEIKSADVLATLKPMIQKTSLKPRRTLPSSL